MYESSDVRVCLLDDSSGVCMYVGWVRSICVGGCGCGWVGVRGGGLEGYVFCCDSLYYGFYFFDFKNNPLSVFLLLIITLNAFDRALMFFIYFLAELPGDR